MFRHITYSLIIATEICCLSSAAQAGETHALLSTEFESRQIVKIEAGDFHFKPGQPAPIHQHKAPAIGYVVKGAILYQVEGEEVALLRAGDAFYEPVGPRILRFDNASPLEEAIFIDFNLQQKGEPFIEFEKPLTEEIDRRTLPTTQFDRVINSNAADIYAHHLLPDSHKDMGSNAPFIGYVDKGSVELKNERNEEKIVKAGETFYLPAGNETTTMSNRSSDVSAKVITFHIKHNS